jgi:Uma2 family endonuclease
MTIGSRHSACTDRVARLFIRALGDSAIVRLGGSVRLGLFSEPELDVVLLKPRADFYAANHPGAADILLIIEVADSTLQFDRTVKSAIYAEAGVHEFWLVDLTSSTIFCSSNGRGRAHRQVRPHRRGDVIAPLLLPDCRIAVSDLLPD